MTKIILPINGKPLSVLAVQQSFKLPTVYKMQKQLSESKVNLQEQRLKLDERLVEKEITKIYNTILFWETVQNSLSIYG